MFWIWYTSNPDQIQPPILHIAPEDIFERHFRIKYKLECESYRTADLFTPADLQINIENMTIPDASFSTVICNHVLEHVNDRQALPEIYRILHKDGIAILSVPIIEGWEHTYEDNTITDPEVRELHFGQLDHVRYYGRDFRDRLSEAGFFFEEVTSQPADVVKHALLRGEKFFVCRKQNTQKNDYM